MTLSPDWQISLKQHDIPKFIAVEGPIGVGKTTLTKSLATLFGYDTLLERAEDNPFLDKFYGDEHNAALPTQLFFLLQRAQQVGALQQEDLFGSKMVADFLIDKDPLFAEVTLDPDELKLYQQVYDHLTIDTPQPDLVIYLQAPADILLSRIQSRGRLMERGISAEYLESLNEAYTRFFHYYDRSPLLIVNAAEIDFANDADDFQSLVDYMLNISSGRHYYNPIPTMF